MELSCQPPIQRSSSSHSETSHVNRKLVYLHLHKQEPIFYLFRYFLSFKPIIGAKVFFDLAFWNLTRGRAISQCSGRFLLFVLFVFAETSVRGLRTSEIVCIEHCPLIVLTTPF